MKFFYGDSTDSNLEFNYLAFLREVIDCSVVLVENEAILARTIEHRREREEDAAGLVAKVEALGRSAAQLAQPVAKEHADAPVGRAAAAIVAAARQAVERESAQVRSVLAGEIAQLDSKDRQLRERSQEVLDKLLRTHDLPDATKVFEVTLSGAGAKATMRQTTKFGVEALIGLEVPANSLLGNLDLRVDRIVEGIEVSGLEAGKWRKSEKLTPHKLGRYLIARIVVGDSVSVRVKATTDANAAGFDITVARDGNIAIDRAGGEPDRDLSIDDRNRSALKTLAEKLESAVRSLATTRTGLVSFQIDGTPLADHLHPRALAERLIVAIAPVVQQIARRSRSPGELVLRVPVGNDRREEIFVSTAELVKRYDTLPAHAKEVFAPLKLAGDTAAQTQPSPRTGATQPPPPPAARSRTPSEVMPLPPPTISAPAPTTSKTDAPPLASPAAAPRPEVFSPSGPIVPTLERQKTSTQTVPSPASSAKLPAMNESEKKPESLAARPDALAADEKTSDNRERSK